jgi:serine/threonine-protein kinase
VHEADTFNEQLLSAMTIPAPSLAGLAPHLPMPVIELVDKALAFDREERWPSARDMQNAVRRVAALLASEPDSPSKKGAAAVAPASPTLVTPSLAPATASTRPSRPRVRQRFLLVALGAAASMLALGVTRELAQRRQVRVAISAPEMAKPALLRGTAAESHESPIAPVPAVSSPITMQVAAPPAVVQPPPAPSTAKHTAEKARPRATTRSSEDARTFVAEPKVTAISPPEPVATPSAVDPLDRRR